MSVLVFVSVRGLSLAVASGGHSSSRCAGLSLSWPLFLRSTGSRCAGSAIVAHGPSCSAVCGIFPDQGSNPCPLHWQADSQPLRHQGSPTSLLLSETHRSFILSQSSLDFQRVNLFHFLLEAFHDLSFWELYSPHSFEYSALTHLQVIFLCVYHVSPSTWL